MGGAQTKQKQVLATGDAVFREVLTVRFGEVDHAGLVYYPRIFHYCHIAYEEWLASHPELALPELLGVARVGTPVVAVQSSFHSPMRHGEKVAVDLTVERVGARSFVMGFRLTDEASGALRSRVEITHACIALDALESIPLPGSLRAHLEGESYTDG